MIESAVRVLLEAEFSSIVSSWTEYLCLQRVDNQIVLSSCGYQVLAEISHYAVEDDDGEYVIGGDLMPHDDDAEVPLEPGDIETARAWLEGREWHLKPGYDGAWREIVRALESRQ